VYMLTSCTIREEPPRTTWQFARLVGAGEDGGDCCALEWRSFVLKLSGVWLR
jgi:hypothetical protein